MTAPLIVLGVIALAIVFVAYACCIVGSRADDVSEEMFPTGRTEGTSSAPPVAAGRDEEGV
jgi:hypothetical protein